jgi:hypothetical protein
MKLSRTFRKILIALSIATAPQLLIAQSLEKYSGPYKWGDNDGNAQYTYINQQGKRIFSGDFKFNYANQGSKGYLKLNISGQFVNGEVDGYWEINLAGKVQGYDLQQKIIGNFNKGVPNGLFSREFSFASETASTKVTYINGRFTGSFEHFDSDEEINIKADFSGTGLLKNRLIQIEKNETIELYFDEKDIASLFVGLVNGEEVKRVDLKAALEDLDPSHVSTDTIEFTDGNEFLGQIWSEGHFGHLDGKGSLNTYNYAKMRYVQYQKLNSLKDAGYAGVDMWQMIDPRKPQTHDKNLTHVGKINSFNTPETDKYKYIIQQEVLYLDTVLNLMKTVQTKDISLKIKDLELKLQGSQEAIQKLNLAYDNIVQLIGEIENLAKETIGTSAFPPMIQLTTIKNANNSISAHYDLVKKEMNAPYALINWQEQLVRLQQLESKENWVVTDTLTAFYAGLQTYFDNQILPWQNKNLELQKLLISSKESEELTRILQILNNEIKANFLQINLNSITFVFDDLIKIQTVFARMLENPSEHYKPVKKALKDATTAQEIRTILAL